MCTAHWFAGLFLGALAALPAAVQGHEYNTIRQLAPVQQQNLDQKKHSLVPRNSSNVEAACFAAQESLGEDQVQVRPGDDAVADENWYVTSLTFPSIYPYPMN